MVETPVKKLKPSTLLNTLSKSSMF